MNQPKSVKVIVFLFGKAVNVLATFLFLPYLVRALSIGEYGTYGQTLLVVEIGKAVAELGLSTVIFVFLSKKGADHKAVFQNHLWPVLFLGLLIGTLFFLFSPMIGDYMNNEGMADLLKVYCFALPFFLAQEVCRSTLIFFDRVKTVAVGEMTFNLLKLLLMLISVQVFRSLELVFWCLLLVSVLSAAFFYVNLPKVLKKGYNMDLGRIKEQVLLGVPLGMTAVLSFLILSTDSLMISSMMGVKDYAVYRNGAIQLPFIATLYFSISTIIFPDVNKYLEAGKIDDMVRLKHKAISLSVILVYPTLIFFLFFSKYFVIFYLSEQYVESAVIFFIYNLVVFTRVNNYRDVLIAYKKTDFILYMVLFSFLVNVVLNYFLISSWGAKGAAVASLISLVVLAVAMFAKTLSLVHRRFSDFFDGKIIFRVLIIATLFSGLAYTLFLRVPQNLGILILFFGGYAAIVYYMVIKFKLVEKKMIYELTDKVPMIGGKIRILIQKI